MDTRSWSSHVLIREHQDRLLAEVESNRLGRDAPQPARWGLPRLIGHGSVERPWGILTAGRSLGHSLSDHPCRLPSGEVGRVSLILVDGEWVLVCKVAAVGP